MDKIFIMHQMIRSRSMQAHSKKVTVPCMQRGLFLGKTPQQTYSKLAGLSHKTWNKPKGTALRRSYSYNWLQISQTDHQLWPQPLLLLPFTIVNHMIIKITLIFCVAFARIYNGHWQFMELMLKREFSISPCCGQ